jgi:hypothetical protein
MAGARDHRQFTSLKYLANAEDRIRRNALPPQPTFYESEKPESDTRAQYRRRT